MMSVGAQLRAARLERNLSMAEVVQAIKIQPWVLEALESDRLHTQMSQIYARGFLGSYARFLKLDAAALISAIAWPGQAAETVQATSLAAQVARANAKVATAAAAAKPAKAAAAPAQPMKVPAQKPAVAPRPDVQEALDTPAPRTIAWPTIRIPTFTLPAFTVHWPTVTRVAKFAAAAAAIAAVIIVNPLRHLPKSSAKTAAKPAAKATTKTAAAPQAVRVQQASVAPVRETPRAPSLPTLTILPTQALELRVTAQRTTWIQVRADGKLVTQQRLQRGAQERWTAKKKLEVVVAKPSQIDLELNGQTISPFAIAHEGRLMITHYGVAKLPNEQP